MALVPLSIASETVSPFFPCARLMSRDGIAFSCMEVKCRQEKLPRGMRSCQCGPPPAAAAGPPRYPPSGGRGRPHRHVHALTLRVHGWYIQLNGGVAKLVIALACQAGGRGFKSRRSRSFFHRKYRASSAMLRPARVSAGRGISSKNRTLRAVAQLVARSVRDRKAAGSNPASPLQIRHQGKAHSAAPHGAVREGARERKRTGHPDCCAGLLVCGRVCIFRTMTGGHRK